MECDYDTVNYIISTSTYTGETFAVISEKIAPIAKPLIPDLNARYKKQSLGSITFFVDDNLSGIKDENNISIELNNIPMIFEYNSYRKQVFLKLRSKLDIGEHNLNINIFDNVGNKKNINGSFFIIP